MRKLGVSYSFSPGATAQMTNQVVSMSWVPTGTGLWTISPSELADSQQFPIARSDTQWSSERCIHLRTSLLNMNFGPCLTMHDNHHIMIQRVHSRFNCTEKKKKL